MFDNPRKSLEALEAELLAAEPPRKRRPAKKEDPDETLEEMKAFLDRDAWQSTHRAPLSRSYDAGIEEELFNAEEPREFPQTGRSGGIRPGLIVAMVLEALGLVAVLIWWLV